MLAPSRRQRTRLIERGSKKGCWLDENSRGKEIAAKEGGAEDMFPTHNAENREKRKGEKLKKKKES